MRNSTRIFAAYTTAFLVAGIATIVLAIMLWQWHPMPDTLAEMSRIPALLFVAVYGIALMAQIATHPLAWRVFRMQRRVEQFSDSSPL